MHFKVSGYYKEGTTVDTEKFSVIDRIALGKRIKDCRTSKKWTQQKLGEKCDITPTNISHIERAQISPSLETLVKIANALEVIENKLAALLSDCSDYEIKMLSEIISNLKSTIRKFNQNKSY